MFTHDIDRCHISSLEYLRQLTLTPRVLELHIWNRSHRCKYRVCTVTRYTIQKRASISLFHILAWSPESMSHFISQQRLPLCDSIGLEIPNHHLPAKVLNLPLPACQLCRTLQATTWYLLLFAKISTTFSVRTRISRRKCKRRDSHYQR